MKFFRNFAKKTMKQIFALFLLIVSVNAYSQTDLLDWGKKEVKKQENEQPQVKSKSCLDFAPAYLNNNFICSDTIAIESRDKNTLFSNLLYWISEEFPHPDNVLIKVDPTVKRILLHCAHISNELTMSATFYEFNTVLQVEDSKIIFQQFDFIINTLGGPLSLSYKKIPFNEIFPDLKPVKKKYEKYLSDMISLNNAFLNGMIDYVSQNNKIIEISHWDEINAHIPALGMNRNECMLAIGKPEKKNNTLLEGLASEQWVYPNSKYVYFSNGKLRSIQF